MNTGLSVVAVDRPGLLRDVAACVAAHGANIDAINHISSDGEAEMHMDLSGVDDCEALLREIGQIPEILSAALNAPVGAIFGKRVIVMGGGAQVAQVVQGAVSEADRHNIRGERISVDTIALVGEEKLAAAVRAVGRLSRARILVLAGSLMGGEVAVAVQELRANHGIPVICLNMPGSVRHAADLVVTDAVQAGVMAVMAVADTAKFDIARVRGQTF